MADFTNFNNELAAVDGTRSFSQTIDNSYGENEWSVDGYDVRAGSDVVLTHGASEALYQLGYRFWTPSKTTRPGSLPAGGVTLNRQQFDFPYVSIFYNYGIGGQAGTDFSKWRDLVCVGDSRRPVGHAWPALINAINGTDSFFNNNPGYIIGVGPGQRFDLTLPQVDIDAMAQRVADHLATNLNEYNRASIDPNDGSQYDTDVVFGFANNVVDRLRLQVPDATLGLYAYAGHRAPVSFACPHLYVNVALGFNDLGIGYPALVEQWSQAIDDIGLRAYGDIAAWRGWSYHPTKNATADYASYSASGAQSVLMETSGNWTKNIIGKFYLQRYWRYGQATYDQILSDAVDKLYEGDSRVADLFNYWSSLGSDLGPNGLSRAAKIIEAMPDSWYRDEFIRYQTFAMVDYRIHAPGIQQHTPTYFTQLERNLRASRAMRDSSEQHHQSYGRQRANSNVNNNGRTDLSFGGAAHWDRYPQPYVLSDLQAEIEKLRELAFVPDELLDDRLVMVDTEPPNILPALITEATFYNTHGRVRFVYVGPGTVNVEYPESSDPDEVLNFGPGLHEFVISKTAFTTWTDGTLFCNFTARTRIEGYFPLRQENWWIYNPKLTKGKTTLQSESNLRIVDEDGIKNINKVRPPFAAAQDPRTIRSGVVMVSNNSTRGFHTAGNINPYISPTSSKALMPYNLARREFPGIVFNGTGQIPSFTDLSDDSDGLSDQTEID